MLLLACNRPISFINILGKSNRPQWCLLHVFSFSHFKKLYTNNQLVYYTLITWVFICYRFLVLNLILRHEKL